MKIVKLGLEEQIIKLKARGLSYRDIATRISEQARTPVSYQAVRNYLNSNLFNKTKQALQKAEENYQKGLIKPLFNSKQELEELLTQVENNTSLKPKDRYWLILKIIQTLHQITQPTTKLTIQTESPTIQIAQIVKEHLEE